MTTTSNSTMSVTSNEMRVALPQHTNQIVFQGVKAYECVITPNHYPIPGRFVFHHVLPKVCGGKTEAANLVQVCDNCHYTIHRIMWALAHNLTVVRVNRKQMALARRGITEATLLGTLDLMPDE